jgi:hypothetical protein
MAADIAGSPSDQHIHSKLYPYKEFTGVIPARRTIFKLKALVVNEITNLHKRRDANIPAEIVTPSLKFP